MGKSNQGMEYVMKYHQCPSITLYSEQSVNGWLGQNLNETSVLKACGNISS